MQIESRTAERIGERPARCTPLPDVAQLLSPPFVPHRLIAGGHLQTVLSLRALGSRPLSPDLHWVELPDGDRLALHDDQPDGWFPGDASLLLIHGLCGCSQSPYMHRLADRFTQRGVRVFRLNLRGCGVGEGEAQGITHAGRSDDIVDALEKIAQLTQAGPIAAVGVSLGGNQLLRAMGMVGKPSSSNPTTHWLHRIHRIAAVSPPTDLQRCSDNMEKVSLRPYNRYFIRHLLNRAPSSVRHLPFIVDAIKRQPKTMRELDERITARLAGYEDATDYYRRTSASNVIANIQVPTLILASADDPIVPASCFSEQARASWSESVRFLLTKHGGHIGFIGRGQERHWMDGLLERWFDFAAIE